MTLPRAPVLVLLILPLGLLLSRCGQEDDKDDKDDDPQTPKGAGVPTDWDGASDYTSSALKVVDE